MIAFGADGKIAGIDFQTFVKMSALLDARPAHGAGPPIGAVAAEALAEKPSL